MIKRCDVISFNKFSKTLVINFDGKEIQYTATLLDNVADNVVYMKYDKNRYSLTTEEDYLKSLKPAKKVVKKGGEKIDKAFENDSADVQ